MNRPALPRCGIGWRHPHRQALFDCAVEPGFIEVHSENHFAPGGAARATLLAAREHHEVSLHGVGLALGSATGIDPSHLRQLGDLVRAVQPVRVSDHASFARAAWSGAAPVHAADLLPTPFTREALDVFCANVQRVQDHLRREIAVENLSSYLRWRCDEMDEPAFLCELVRRTGCTLLLDINNLVVNALNDQRWGMGGDPAAAARAWIDRLPAGIVAEFHLAGHTDAGDIVIDDHGSPVPPAVWSLYRHAVQRLGPVPALIEWDTDLPPFEVLMAQALEADRIQQAVLAPLGQPQPAEVPA
ncbi:MAG: DUF692 domain-containing protein [Hydrogenophaga sp.]|nr:DUF692 domain-containing protein [Hydrogenophaga sp.]